jgi:Effector Associated Constant Component 1
MDDGSVEISAGRVEDLEALYAELRGMPGIAVRAVSAPTRPGDQGAVVDLLTVACSGGAFTALLQVVKTLLESRGPGFVLKVRRGRDRLEITAENAEEALPLIKELLGGP